VEVEAL